jgi:hypothetical protein
MKHKNALFRIFLWVSLLALANGCFDFRISVRPTDLPTSGKLPLHAVLVLNKDLANYKYEFNNNGVVYPFGLLLQDYARHVVSASFQQVDEADSSEKAFANSSADIVLIPRPVKVKKSLGMYGFDTNSFTFVVEWIGKDRGSQNTVWLKTITADASETTWNDAFHPSLLVQKLFDDLSIKTLEAFQKAPELRNNPH